MLSLNVLSSGLESSKLLSANSKENTRLCRDSTLLEHGEGANQNITILQDNAAIERSMMSGPRRLQMNDLEFLTQDAENLKGLSGDFGMEVQSMSFSNELIQDGLHKQVSAGATRSKENSATRTENDIGVLQIVRDPAKRS